MRNFVKFQEKSVFFLNQIWNQKWLFLHNHITYEYQTKNHLWDLLRRAHRQFNANLGTFSVKSLKIFYLGIFQKKLGVKIEINCVCILTNLVCKKLKISRHSEQGHSLNSACKLRKGGRPSVAKYAFLSDWPCSFCKVSLWKNNRLCK